MIESIQSRLHIIKMRPPSEEHINNIINEIIKNENIRLDGDSKKHLINISNGSLRTIINYLEKKKSY